MRTVQLERINFLWFLTLGTTALAAGILVYILLLESALGAFSITDASPAEIGVDRRPRVALLNSDYTKRTHRAINVRDTSTAWVDQTLQSWREFLIDKVRKIPFMDINDEDLESGDLDAFDVLILPSVRAMSDLQLKRIQEFMNRGGSVLATWTAGVYREDGSWRGWNFVEETFGVQFEGYVERGRGNYRIYADTFPGFTPAGIYLPKYVAEDDRADLFAPISEEREEVRRVRQQQARRAEFAPLQDYVWFDSLNSARPTVNFARAQPITASIRGMDGLMRVQDAVVVSYFTWTGGDPRTEIPYPRTSSGIRRFTFLGNTPLTANIVSGYRVKIQVYNLGVRVRVTERDRAKAAGFWYDMATEDFANSDILDRSTGLVYGTYGAGRFVYMGFQRNAMGTGPSDVEDQQRLDYFFSNLINYLRRQPVIWTHDWPSPYHAAAMISGVTKDNIGGFRVVADMLDQEGIPGTYFVQPENASPYGQLLRRLYNQGDVGVYDSLRIEADGSQEVQRRRLDHLRRMLEGIVGGPVQGYRSTERGILGRNTMGGLTEAHYTYFLPDSIGRRMVPKIMGFPYETLTRTGMTVKSDMDVMIGMEDQPDELLRGLMLDGVNRSSHEGSLYNLIYSPDLLGSPERLGVLRSIVRRLKQENFWIASGDSIAFWWRIHKGINADVEQRSPSRIFVRVSNDNGSTAQKATVSIALGRAVTSVNVRPELINIFKPVPDDIDIPAYQLKENGTVLELSIKELKPQQYRIFHIDLLAPDFDERFANN